MRRLRSGVWHDGVTKLLLPAMAKPGENVQGVVVVCDLFIAYSDRPAGR